MDNCKDSAAGCCAVYNYGTSQRRLSCTSPGRFRKDCVSLNASTTTGAVRKKTRDSVSANSRSDSAILFFLTKNYFPFKFSLFFCFLTFAITLCFGPTNCYVLTHEGPTRTYLHRRLAGRERREVQREILSLLGLRRRPRPSGNRVIEKTSAPLYMIGLYSKASTEHLQRSNELDLNSDISAPTETSHNRDSLWWQEQSSHRRRAWARSAGPFGTGPDMGPYSPVLGPALTRYVEDSGILTNEVGVFDFGTTHSPTFTHPMSSSSGTLTSEVERRLLDDSDLVMSFVNAKPPANDEETVFQSEDMRTFTRRHRSFYFDLSHVTPGNHLSAARFRLFKDKSEQSLGNTTLRINVYEAVPAGSGRASIYLLGSRLVGSRQEGWLVYDIFSAVSDWIRLPNMNTGLKVTAETVDGTYVKPSKAGIIGRKGDPTKQAFLVAFFSHSDDTNLSYHIRRRQRRSATSPFSSSTRNQTQSDVGETNSNGLHDNDTENTLTEADHDTNGNEQDYDGYDDNGSETATVNNARGNETPAEEPEEHNRRVRRRGRKRKKKRKNRKRNKSRENCQKRQLYVNFKDLQWEDWIIAPKGYPAYYCDGECGFPLNARMNATNHAIVQSLVHLMQPRRKLPKPCCSPTTLDVISVLYFNDDSNVVYKKYNDMIVKTCGCH